MIAPTAAGSRPVALVGLPGTGKTTLGRRLADRLGWELCDTDAEIERGTGRSPAQIIDLDGEDAFRRIELATVTELLERPRAVVIACGGGLFGEPATRRRLLEAAWVVALDAPDSTLLERLGSASDRPLLVTSGLALLTPNTTAASNTGPVTMAMSAAASPSCAGGGSAPTPRPTSASTPAAPPRRRPRPPSAPWPAPSRCRSPAPPTR